MCVAIFKPPGKSISKKDLKLCFDRNPDGAGFMYPKDGKVVVVKGMFTFDSFWRAYRDKFLNVCPNSGAVIHFRIGTSGKKDEINCHPHVVSEDFAFVHNGIMSNYAKTQSDFSDTIHFRDEIVTPIYEALGQEMLNVSPIHKLLSDHIGSNKMIFLSGSGYAWTLNAHLGTEIDGVWFSNTNWQPYVASTVVYPSNYDDYGSSYNGFGSSSWRDKRKDSAFRGGCYIQGLWHNWNEYRDMFPDKTGPFEAEHTMYADAYNKTFPGLMRNRKGGYYDNDLKLWVHDSKKKEPDCTEPSCEIQPTNGSTGTIGSEIDDRGNVLGGTITPMSEVGEDFGTSYVDIFPESRCVNCLKDLSKAEADAGEHVCTACMIEITNPSGA